MGCSSKCRGCFLCSTGAEKRLLERKVLHQCCTYASFSIEQFGDENLESLDVLRKIGSP